MKKALVAMAITTVVLITGCGTMNDMFNMWHTPDWVDESSGGGRQVVSSTNIVQELPVK